MTKKNRKNQAVQKHVPYDDIVRENADFIQYYKKQAICAEIDWNTFLDALRSTLPSTFRITASRSESSHLLNLIKNELIVDLLKAKEEFEVPHLECFSWYPNQLAWQIDLSRKDLRRLPSLARLHQFLITETENGTISRQEAVSMIPPLLLDVQPHHKVFDMCASPGSKTAQIIEHLHANDTKDPVGFVIANDIDNKRCYMLVHQAKRLNSPSVLVTCHDAGQFPKLMVKNQGQDEELKFDRILCDAPCTGDGTMRKNPDIWMKWSVGNGINHHNIQYRILKRGAELLRIGGRLVYSTCSLNPLENEAVVNRIITESNNALVVADLSSMLPGLKFSKGLRKWFVTTKRMGQFYEKFEDVPESCHALIRPQMFPSDDSTMGDQLERCIRILPHQQNSGGFFIAVLEKLSDTNFATGPQTSWSKAPNSKKRRTDGYKEDPYVFFERNYELWPSIQEFYEISASFDPQNLLTRCNEGKKKNIYYCTPSVRDLVVNNFDQLKCINTGVKVFVRCDNTNTGKCNFRLCHEGLDSIIDHLGSRRRVTVTKEDLVKILTNNDPEDAVKIENLSESCRTFLENFDHGSCFLVLNDAVSDLHLEMSGWRGTSTLRAYISNINAIHYLRILGADVTKLEKYFNKFNKPAEGNQLPKQSESEEKLD